MFSANSLTLAINPMTAQFKSSLTTGITTGLNATKRLVSIRWSLPLCVVTPLVSGILLSSWLAFRNGQKAVDELVGKISAEVAANIEKQVDSYLTKPSLISAVIEAEVASGNLNIQDIRELGETLWTLTQADGLTNNLFYGNELGEFVYSERHDGVNRMDFVDKATNFQRIAYEVDDEFSKLARLFNDMAIVVMSRQQSLSEQGKLLKTEIDQHGGNASSDRQKLEVLLRHAKQVRQTYRIH